MQKTSNRYNELFKEVIRGKKDISTDNALAEGYEAGTDSYTIPYGNDNTYTDTLAEEDLFRRYGTVIHTPTSEGFIQTVACSASAEFVNENAAYTLSEDIFTRISFNSYKLATLSKLNNTFVADTHFDLESYLNQEFAKRFGKAEEDVFLNGSGTDEPSGLLPSATVGVTATSASNITFDEVMELYSSVKPEYRKRGVWVMNDDTALVLRTLKDADGNYLWRTNDDTILGKTIEISPYAPDIASEATPLAFGDLSYYWVIERKSLAVRILTELYAVEGMTGFAAHERIDGKLIRPEAVKTLQMA